MMKRCARFAHPDCHPEVPQFCLFEARQLGFEGPHGMLGHAPPFHLGPGQVIDVGAVEALQVDQIEVGGLAGFAQCRPRSLPGRHGHTPMIKAAWQSVDKKERTRSNRTTVALTGGQGRRGRKGVGVAVCLLPQAPATLPSR